MQNVLKISGIALIILAMTACSSFRLPGQHLVPVQQGNFVEQDMIDQLEVGLTKRQVRYIMGTPMIEDTFNSNRWDYFYDVKRGNKTLKTNRFTVYFKDGALTHWEGDYGSIKKDIEDEQEKALKDTEKKEKAKF